MRMKKISSPSLGRMAAMALVFVLIGSLGPKQAQAQTTFVKKTILQGFWWDYWNNNFRFGWANYLTELAPRLKAMGFDAVWIPPAAKNSSPGSVGYAPFDHYDLGDKFQKGTDSVRVFTRLGTKDELLRLIAVLHANGIEVIEDMVLNHNTNAGTLTGAGGRDPQSPHSTQNSDGFKNFRYVCYATPGIDESQNDYWTRAGRWAKNFQNFHPNPANNCIGGDLCSAFWGPDIDYATSGANGQSSNIPTSGNATIGTTTRAFFNPIQSANYMRQGVRDQMMWFNKQTNIDGYRFDAVKHFDIATQKLYTMDVKYNIPAWSAGGQDMLNFAEWVAGASDLDNYVTNVAGGPGTYEEHTGTFDFSLRGYSASGGLYSMVLSNGSYNMQSIPGSQQSKRWYDYGTKRVYRSVTFVNSHDTYRPRLDSVGNFLKPLGDNTGWDMGQELGGNGAHIDPREPRLAAAYAVAFAVDANPCVYIEDLFDIGTTGRRWTHVPTSTTELPQRNNIVNIMQAHQRLDFKSGAYGVPSAITGANAPVVTAGSLADHLVIERAGRAVIGITDAFSSTTTNSADQTMWVTVDASLVGRFLFDYSGAHGVDSIQVFPDRRVNIRTAPNGHNIPGAFGRGYSIWAPRPAGVAFNTRQDIYDYLATYQQTRSTLTTQEWEMADDLGDSHCNSLGQGGRIPDNRTNERFVGRIFGATNKLVTVKVLPEVDGRNITVTLYDKFGTVLATQSGVTTVASPVTVTYTPPADGWISIKVRNTVENQLGQRVWVNVAYTAPTSVDTRGSISEIPTNVSIWTGNRNTTNVADCGNWEAGRVPGPNSHVIVYGHAKPFPVVTQNITVNRVTLHPGATMTVNPGINLTVLSQ